MGGDHFASVFAPWLGWSKVGDGGGRGWLAGLVGLAAKYSFRVLANFFEFLGARPPPRPPTHSLRGFFTKNKGFVLVGSIRSWMPVRLLRAWWGVGPGRWRALR